MGSKGVVWRPIATIAAAVGDVELEDQVLRLSRYLGYAKVLLNNFYFLGGGPALKNKGCYEVHGVPTGSKIRDDFYHSTDFVGPSGILLPIFVSN